MAVRVNSCLICNGIKLKKHNAIVVPFIAKKVFNREPFNVKLIECKNCGFKFFNLRLDDDEMSKFYIKYFTPDYIKERRRYEPWLIKLYIDIRFNKKSFINKADLVDRLFKKYKANLDVQIESSLDFGGDNGQVISKIFNNAEKYVYDISNVKLVPGVKKATDLPNRTYDFILCMDVLEHVAYPKNIIEKINKMAHQGTIFYFQVPYEQPNSIGTLTKRIIQQFFLLVFRFDIFILTLKSGMLVHMHEHINYFSIDSLRQLLENIGYKNIQISIETVNNGKYISCFTQKDD